MLLCFQQHGGLLFLGNTYYLNQPVKSGTKLFIMKNDKKVQDSNATNSISNTPQAKKPVKRIVKIDFIDRSGSLEFFTPKTSPKNRRREW